MWHLEVMQGDSVPFNMPAYYLTTFGISLDLGRTRKNEGNLPEMNEGNLPEMSGESVAGNLEHHFEMFQERNYPRPGEIERKIVGMVI